MTLGIVSDTHGFFHPHLPRALSGVDAILHAGDVGTIDVLERLEQIAPAHAVYGNIDGTEIRHVAGREVEMTFDGIRVFMTHIGGHPGRWAPGIRERLMARQPNVFVCGHSHILRIERVKALGNMLYLNPGAAGRQGFHLHKTVVILELCDETLKTAQVVHLDE
jgi:putative phosphoesterase